MKKNLMVAVFAMLVVMVSFDFVFADNTVVDEINIIVPVSCTLTGTGMNTHNATINNGQYESAIGETVLKAFCNDNNGFAIYANGYTDGIDGKNVLTNAALGSTYDIATGTLTSGVSSQWAMKLSTVTSPVPTYAMIIAGSSADTDKAQGDPDYTAFQQIPNDYALVAYRKASTDIGTNAEGATLKTTYQAYINATQPAGTYSGQVKYTMVHPYNVTAPETPLGLCTSSFTCMQQQTNDTIAAQLPSIGSTTTMYDSRDGQAYTIAKLADGKYWMTENLNIAGGTALSSDDTDFEDSYTLPTTNGWTVSDGKLVLPASATKNANDNNLTDSTQFGTNNHAYVFNSGNKTNCGASGQDIPCYSYYSWDAVTLGSSRSANTDGIDAPYSICPSGWVLPTSGAQSGNGWKRGDFYPLAQSYGADLENAFYDDTEATGANFYNNAGPGTIPNFLLAGFYSAGSFSYGGLGGLYWSFTMTSSRNNAHILYYSTSHVYSADSFSRSGGLSVRCLFDDTNE